ncbi:hypothetical protein [Pasteuria penetrans]|uniref:hypothetical protein n=1 Tax=Pasteuria penetrans TaxID=86005 RepID=UPI001CAA420C|nr:hypothetical protein [Pasteuria penetrans]
MVGGGFVNRRWRWMRDLLRRFLLFLPLIWTTFFFMNQFQRWRDSTGTFLSTAYPPHSMKMGNDLDGCLPFFPHFPATGPLLPRFLYGVFQSAKTMVRRGMEVPGQA